MTMFDWNKQRRLTINLARPKSCCRHVGATLTLVQQ
jgi:hypothetical protein